MVEVNDSGFLGTVPTLRTQLLTDDSMLQVSGSDTFPRQMQCSCQLYLPGRTCCLGAMVVNVTAVAGASERLAAHPSGSSCE